MEDLEDKMDQLKDELDLARQTGDRRAEAAALHGIGRIYGQKQVYAAAEDFWNQSRDVCRESGQPAELAQVLIDLGDLARRRDQTGPAGEYYDEALSLYLQLDDPKGQARALERLGGLKAEQDHLKEALHFFQKGLDLCRTHGDSIGALYFLDQIIPLLKGQGLAAQVLIAYRELVTRAEKVGDRERMALGLAGLADVYQRTGKPEEAVPYLAMAHDLYLHLSKTYEAGLIRGELEKLGYLPDQTERPR